ncbi:MAG: hypothetical protein Kow00128_18310 [Deltaproteobacteria bacterium]
MDCLEIRELLSAFLDGETSPEESRRVEEHLSACAGCRAFRERARSLDSFLARSETPVSPDFREKLFSRLEAEELLPRRRSLFSFSVRWALPLAAAAALGLFLLISKEVPKGPATPANPPQVATNLPEAPETVARLPAAPKETPRAVTRAPAVPPEEIRAAENLPAEAPSAPSQAPDRAGAAPREPEAPAVAAREDLTPEEREIVAYLEVLEDPSSFEEPDEIDEMEILLPGERKAGVAG